MVSKQNAKLEAFQAIIEELAGKKLLVPIKGSPDPDSICAAMFIKELGSLYGFECDIITFANVSHQENLALLKTLDIEIESWSENVDYSIYEGYAIVDAQSAALPPELEGLDIECYIHIDHHKKLPSSPKAKFVDIRESAGSTASICADYMSKNLLYEMSSDVEDHVKLCTALSYGIKSDTDNYTLANKLDFAAISYLSEYTDKEVLATLARQQISTGGMEIIRTALTSKQINGRYLFSSVGYVRKEERDSIGTAADFLLKLEGIDTVVIFGIVNNEWIDGSMRTTAANTDPDNWIKDAFGKNEHGAYYGGGRKEKGAFQIPLGLFNLVKDKKMFLDISNDMIMNCLLDKIGVGDDTE